MNFAAMLGDQDYLDACERYRIDPVVGPVTSFQRINVMVDVRRARAWRLVTQWWLTVDWLDEGKAHSETEFDAFLRLWVRVLYASDALKENPPPLPKSRNHNKPLRDVLAARGEKLEWIEDADGIGGVWIVVETVNLIDEGAAD